jgi:hypothetical protein
MGVAGDLTRGAFWSVGGEDRINIDCETGVVKLKNGLQVSSIKTDIIQSLSSTTVRIEDNLTVGGSVSLESYLTVNGAFAAFGDSAFSRNVSIAGTLTVNGANISAGSNTSPFWACGKVGSNGAALSTKGRYGFGCSRVAAGTYTITPTTSYTSNTYVVNMTCHGDGAEFTARVSNNSNVAASFQILTYVNGVVADAVFTFSVVN